MKSRDNPDEQALIDEAKVHLLAAQDKQSVDAEKFWSLARGLIKIDEFNLAKRLLDKMEEFHSYPADGREKFVQKHALATYKDPALNRNLALQRGLDILNAGFDLSATQDQETLGLVGAIYKRMWEVDGNKLNLERSLQYYRRGFELGIAADGYTAINAAFVQDLLARLEESQARASGAVSRTAQSRREDAGRIRNKIIESLEGRYTAVSAEALKPDDYWAIATLAEASLGLKRYQAAKRWLALVRGIKGIPEWEYESTARQLVRLVQIQPGFNYDWQTLDKSEAWQALIDFLGQREEALRTLFQGKLGLALSGGGFRASLYHIGVLAKLAELDLLRHVEVLSCVSGGSIIGAHYYLELRRLFNLERKRDTGDGRIERTDYIGLVENLVRDFTAGIQKNPRVRILAKPWANLKMIFSPAYSRTHRLGELYESLIYSRVQDGEGGSERWLNDLFIHPVEAPNNFNPRRDNWTRRCKIPQLVLNATTLNSGHNWQFTASWMGESPVAIDVDVDSNDRYRRLYYEDAPIAHRQVRLGVAVGASSCVPGLFEPVIFKGLFEQSTVRLVDGGVYDNQGVASLLEQDCDQIIVSDAVGQLNSEGDPGGGVVAPLLRTNSIMMHRVRGAQYDDLKARCASGLLKGFAYMHLKEGLEGQALNWIGCREPVKEKSDRSRLTDYGVRKDVQELLAGVRTDLDSFSDLECYALMTSGYLNAEQTLRTMDSLHIQAGERHAWDFLKLAPAMTGAENAEKEYRRLMSQLKYSHMTFFKVWLLYPPLKLAAMAVGLALVAWFVISGIVHPDQSLVSDRIWEGIKANLTLGKLLFTVAGILVGVVAVHVAGKIGRAAIGLGHLRETLYRILIGLGIGVVGWLGARLHLHLFDCIFKRIGRVS